MATHYKLTASYKNNYSFFEEQELDTNITTLEEIDYITCRYPSCEYLLQLLDNDGIISGKNHLSIRYKSKNQCKYLHPIFNMPELMDIIDNLQERQVYQNGHPMTYKCVNHSSVFFQEKIKEFYQFLDGNPDYFFNEVYGKNKPKRLTYLVNLYFNGKSNNFYSLEDEYAWRDLGQKIELEFSRYKTFRGYLLYVERYKNKFSSQQESEVICKTENYDLPVLEEFDFEKEEFLSEEEIMGAVPEGTKWHHAPRKII